MCYPMSTKIFEWFLIKAKIIVTQEFAYFMFVMVMSLLLPILIMLGSYLAIVVVIFRLNKFSFANLRERKPLLINKITKLDRFCPGYVITFCL